MLGLGASLLLASPAHARIDVDQQKHEESDEYRGDFRFGRAPGKLDYIDFAVRMGIATFEGKTYFAFIGQNANGITIAPAEDARQGVPTFNRDLGVEAKLPSGDNGRAYVVALIPREGLLYVIFRSDNGRVYSQAFKSQDGTFKLAKVGDQRSIVSQGSALTVCGAVNGDDGIYVLGLWKQDAGADLKFVSFILKPGKDFDRVSGFSAPELPIGVAADQVNAFDAIGTHEFNAANQLEEIHYLVWADKNKRIWQIRYRPPVRDIPFGIEVRDTNLTTALGTNQSTILTLVEGGMKGDATTESGLSLVEFGANFASRKFTMLRQIAISGTQHFPSGAWSDTNFNFEGDRNHLITGGSTVHWGVDKDRIDAGGVVDGPQGTRFRGSLQQTFRFGVVSFHITPGPGVFPDSKYTSFHGGTVLGNRFVTDSTPTNKDGTTVLDTSTALDGNVGDSLFGAWTLVGVVHGLPPYVPFATGRRYPSLKFTYSASVTSSTSISDTTEDSKEVSVAVSLGGGDIARGAGAAAGLFSVEASYTYGFKSIDGTTSTISVTKSKSTSQTFDPDDTSFPFPPDEIGVLFYSAPTFVSKGYSMRRWNGDTFTNTARNIYMTVVAKRQLHTIYYLLDHPERGPLMGQGLQPDANYKALTDGIDPVPRTSNLHQWRTTQVKDLADYQQFSDQYDTATFTADTGSSGSFALNYTYTDSESKTHSETKSHKGTLKISGGLKGIFNITVSGAISSSNTLATTSTSTTSVGTGIAGDYPRLTRTSDLPNSITTSALVVYAKGDKVPSWTPTALRGTSSPFLLTWTADNVQPPIYGRKPWKMPGYRQK